MTLHDGVDALAPLAGPIDTTVYRTLEYGGVPFSNGLTVVLVEGVAAVLSIVID